MTTEKRSALKTERYERSDKKEVRQGERAVVDHRAATPDTQQLSAPPWPQL